MTSRRAPELTIEELREATLRVERYHQAQDRQRQAEARR
jgi:hypothetical protein